MGKPTDGIRSAREVLKELESENKYVFHGSENPDIDLMEPRQAYNYINEIQEKDGEPAVFASSEADYAILMALINKRNCPRGYSSSAGTAKNKNGGTYLKLGATKEALDQLDDNSYGYVYVFDKELFKQRDVGGVEYMSTVPVSSVKKVTVTKKDLPPNIEVL